MININTLLEKVQPIINKVTESGYQNDLKKEWLLEDLERISNVGKYDSLASIKIFNNSSIKIELSKNFYLSVNVEIPSLNKNDIEKLTIILDIIEKTNEEIKTLKE